MADVPKDITAAAQGAVDRMPELKAMIDPGEFWELVQREVEAALLSERERRTAQGVTWQPGETAPKDGTPILVAQGDTVKSTAWVSRTYEYQELVSTKGNRQTYEWRKEDAGYWDADDIFDPTHWAPLPAAPLSTSAGGGERG